MSEKYVLDSAGNPQVEPDLIKWAEWFENGTFRRLALTEIEGIRISTVFLGLDHDFTFQGPPILWETMVFGGELDQEMDRYATREQALAGHEEMVKKVKRPMAWHGKLLTWWRSIAAGRGWGKAGEPPTRPL